MTFLVFSVLPAPDSPLKVEREESELVVRKDGSKDLIIQKVAREYVTNNMQICSRDEDGLILTICRNKEIKNGRI